MKTYLKYSILIIVIAIVVLGFCVVNKVSIDFPEKIVSVILINISILGALAIFLLWNKYGNDEPIVKKVSSNLPIDINSAELGFYYKGESTITDVMSLVVYLATKGYLKIERDDDIVLLGRGKTVKIVKLKEYDGNNEIEREFFKELFKIGNPNVTELDLENKFYKAANRIEDKLENNKKLKKVFDDNGDKKGLLVLKLGIIIYVLVTILPIFQIYGIKGMAKCIVFAMFQLVGIYFLTNPKGYEYIITKISFYFLSVILILGTGFSIIEGLNGSKYYIISYIVGLISFIVIMFIRKYMPKRTKFGTQILGEIEGFKDFIQNVNKDELEKLVSENKNYFFDILPYSYVLEIENLWFEKFENIKIEKPEWFSCEEEFKLKEFRNDIKNLINILIFT